MDALTQLIEPYVSLRANPAVDALCVEGIRRAARSLRLAVEDGKNTTAREDMALASLFGGLALANAGLGAVHGFAAPIGGMFPAPHGATCAALLPQVIRSNLNALRKRQPTSPALPRFDELARLLTGRPNAAADDAVTWTTELCGTIRIKPLACYGLRPEDLAAITEKAMQSSSMKANPITLTPAELTEILAAAL
jgi:alcohol dehydrogenase class IV